MNPKRFASTGFSRSRIRIWAALGVLSLGPGAAAAGCSLNLDHSLIGQDAGTDGTAGGDDGPAMGDGGPQPKDGGLVVDAGACQSDMDCQNAAAPAGACVTSAKCDPTWHVCMLDTCDVGACKAAVCNPMAKTCSVPTTFGFTAASFSVGFGGVGGYGPYYAIAAVWPFVFVLTTNGAVAYNVVDPTNTSPPLVPVHGVPFLPDAVVTVGRRVYFVQRPEGNGPTIYRQAVAWIDVPQNPFVPSFDATNALLGTPLTSVSNVLSDESQGFFLTYNSQQGPNSFPTSDVTPPLDDTTTLSPVPNAGLASGAGVVAASGPRLVTYRYDGSSQTPYFALVPGAGMGQPQTTGEQQISSFGPLDSRSQFTMGPDGTVLWTTGVLDLTDSGSSDGIATARLVWPLSSATQANFDATTYVDLQTYSPPTGALVMGPAAWIDANTALATSAAGSLTTDTTEVQVAIKGAPGSKPPATLVPNARKLLQVGPGSVGVASSNGFGYVLQQNDPKNVTATITIFAPACVGDQ